MDRVSDEKGEQPILSVIIDKEKSTFQNILCKIEEKEQGIISDLTVGKINNLLEKTLQNITKEEYETLRSNGTPLINLIYDLEEINVVLYTVEAIKSVENYKKLEKEILKSASVDLEISIR